MSATATKTKDLSVKATGAFTPINLVGRRIHDEAGIWPPYSRIKSWAYDGKFRTVIISNKPAVAEADWDDVKRQVLALNGAA